MLVNGIKIVFGGAAFISGHTVADVEEWLKTLEELGIDTIDTAEIYGASEDLLGQAGAASRFTIDTKAASGFGDTPATNEVIIRAGEASLLKLKTDTVDVYYLHAPDRRLPWKETLAGVNELHKRGAFKRLGLSNFLGPEITEVVRVAKENNFVLPTVYQGNYSAVARRAEEEILPALLSNNIRFYVYSPIAGGFLSKSREELSDPEGRFGDDKNPLAELYNGMYNRPSLVAALDVWGDIARQEGISRAELAYRWVVYHSIMAKCAKAIIVGARKPEQLRETVAAMKKGPLSVDAVVRIQKVWESVEGEALLDNFQHLGKP